jgi:hypothetical protein
VRLITPAAAATATTVTAATKEPAAATAKV